MWPLYGYDHGTLEFNTENELESSHFLLQQTMKSNKNKKNCGVFQLSTMESTHEWSHLNLVTKVTRAETTWEEGRDTYSENLCNRQFNLHEYIQSAHQ